MKQEYTFLSPLVVKSSLLDVNLGLDYLIQVCSERSSFDPDDITVILRRLCDIQGRVHMMFADVEQLENRVNTAVNSLQTVN